MWLKWFPWKFAIRRLARSHGFMDPIAILSYFRRFAQPSEVMVPIELLREGVVFHARGLINSRVIQQNLDWVWPYWVHRQFDPADEAFIPRAFSLDPHQPDLAQLDRGRRPRLRPAADRGPARARDAVLGRVVPGCLDRRGGWHDARSFARLVARASALDRGRDARTKSKGRMPSPRGSVSTSRMVWPSSRRHAWIGWNWSPGSEVVTQPDLACRLTLRAKADRRAWLVVSARPCNPEGISFIHRISLNEDRDQWSINRRHRVHFGEPAELYAASDYAHGDVIDRLFRAKQRRTIVCDVGMATAAVLFEIHGGSREVVFHVPLREKRKWPAAAKETRSSSDLWAEELKHACRLQVPDERMQFLYDAALRTVILHSPDDVYPGPFTYKRFWFRDAAFILHAMLCAGLSEPGRRGDRAVLPASDGNRLLPLPGGRMGRQWRGALDPATVLRAHGTDAAVAVGPADHPGRTLDHQKAAARRPGHVPTRASCRPGSAPSTSVRTTITTGTTSGRSRG